MPAEQVAAAVRQRQGRAAPQPKGEVQTFRLRDSFKVIVSSPRPLAREDVLDALEQAAAAVRAEGEA